MREAREKRRGEGGFALVMTLLVTAVLVAVVGEYAYGVYVSTERAANYRDSQRAGHLAAVGVELAHAAMEEILRVRPNMVFPEGGLTFTRTEDGMTIDLRIEDELARVSPRVVYEATGADNDRVMGIYTRLLDSLDLDTDLAETLADWIDADDEPRVYGAEAPDFYSTLTPPYAPANTYPATTGELRMVKGYTPEVVSALEPFVSSQNVSGLININNAPREVVMALSEDVTEDLADELISHRRENPFTDRSDVMKVRGFETVGFNLLDKIVVNSNLFRVYSRASSGGAVAEVEAVVKTGGGVLYWRER